ncbi:hypothetical protein M3J09_009859 [Ascochyta lentis]
MLTHPPTHQKPHASHRRCRSRARPKCILTTYNNAEDAGTAQLGLSAGRGSSRGMQGSIRVQHARVWRTGWGAQGACGVGWGGSVIFLRDVVCFGWGGCPRVAARTVLGVLNAWGGRACGER